MNGTRKTARYLGATLGLVLVLAVGAGVACYHFSCDRCTHEAARDGDVMGWMRHEFCLNEAQYAEILRLHAQHSAVCAQHCAAVRTAREQVAASKRSAAAAGLASAQQELQQAEAVCRTSTEAHVRRVAAAMAPEQGMRYLALVLPRLSALDHEGPPNPRLDR